MLAHTCYTMIDITRTNVLSTLGNVTLPFVDAANHNIVSSSEWNVARNQQRNWDALLQVIGLKTLLTSISYPEMLVNSSLDAYSFGTEHVTPATVWKFQFSTMCNKFANEIDPYGELRRDLDHVPAIINLLETATLHPSVFVTFADFTNTYFILNR